MGFFFSQSWRYCYFLMIKWYFDQKLSRLGKRALYWKSSDKWSTSFYPFPDMVLRNFDIRGTAVHLCSKSRARSYWKASTNWRKYRTNLGFRLYWKTDEKTGSRSWNWKIFIQGLLPRLGQEVRRQIDLHHENYTFWPEKRTCITEKFIMNCSMIFQAKTSSPLLKVSSGEGRSWYQIP